MARLGSHTVELQKGDGASPEVFTANVAQVLSIGGPSLSRETIDTTAADAADDWRTFIASYIDGGEISLEINYDPDEATHAPTAGILEAFASNVATNYRIQFPTSPVTTWSFSAICVGFESSAPHDGVLTASVTYKVLGKVTLA